MVYVYCSLSFVAYIPWLGLDSTLCIHQYSYLVDISVIRIANTDAIRCEFTGSKQYAVLLIVVWYEGYYRK